MPEPELQSTALRYAAGDLAPPDAAAFEERLALDQDARDALSEAVRLSAAAIGQSSPKPGAAFRELLRERLRWNRSRGFAWAAGGAAVVAACALVVLAHAERPEAPAPEAAPVVPFSSGGEIAGAPNEPDAALSHEGTTPVAAEGAAPAACGEADPNRSVAEIWAAMSTPEHVEKARDDEARWRHKAHTLAHPHHASPPSKFDAP